MKNKERVKLPRVISERLYEVSDAEGLDPQDIVAHALLLWSNLMTFLADDMEIYVKKDGQEELWLSKDTFSNLL